MITIGVLSFQVDRIIFCVFLSKDIEVYEQNLLKYFPISRGGDKPGMLPYFQAFKKFYTGSAVVECLT